MAEKWEYFTTFLWARAEGGVLKTIQQTRRNAAKFAPEAMVPQLNALGEQGWELIHIEPVLVGQNDDIMMPTDGPKFWMDTYFCAFKRRKP